MPRLTDGLGFDVAYAPRKKIGQGTETASDDSIYIPGEVGDYVTAGEPIPGMNFAGDEPANGQDRSQEPNLDASSDSFYRSKTFQHAMEEVGHGLANFISQSTFLLSLSDIANWGLATHLEDVLPFPVSDLLDPKISAGTKAFAEGVDLRKQEQARSPEWYIEQNLPLPSHMQAPAGTIWRGTSHFEGDDNGFEASGIDLPVQPTFDEGPRPSAESGQSTGRSARSGPSQEGFSEPGRRRKETYASTALFCDPGLPREQQPWWCR